MPKSLALLEEIFPQKEAQLIEDGRKLDCIQPLLRLGYLSLDQLSDDQAQLDSAISKAVILLRQEAIAAGFPFALLLHDALWLPDAASLEWMQSLLALENEFPLLNIPADAELSLSSRILHYRLWAYGFWKAEEASLPWSQNSQHRLFEFASLFKCTALKALSMLGNIHEIIDQVLDEPHFFFQKPQLLLVDLAEDLDEELKEKTPRKFLRRLRQNLPDAEWEKIRLWFNAPSNSILKNVFESKHNLFGLRLLRIYQWVKGYYRGDLGPAFGKKSLQSLKELGKAEGFSLKEVLGFAAGEYWAINIVFLLRQIDETPSAKIRGLLDERTPESLEGLGEVMQKIVQAQQQKKRNKKTIRAQSSENEIEIIRSLSDETNQKIQSIRDGWIDYVGGKTMIKTAGKILQKFWTWLSNIWEDIKNALKNALGLITRGLRRAYLAVTDGIRFLVGKRLTVSENLIFTKMDFDFDVVNGVNGPIDAPLIQQHSIALRSKVDALNSTIYVLGKVLRIVYDVNTPDGWVHLGMKIISAIKSAANELFNKKTMSKAATV